MIRPTPFDEIEQMFDRMRRSMWTSSSASSARNARWADSTETDTNLRLDPTPEGYVVLADLPGFGRGEIDLRFGDGVLTIDADQEIENEHAVGSRRVLERVTVPTDADIVEDDIEATFSNGVLEVFLPTVEAVATEDEDGSVHIEID